MKIVFYFSFLLCIAYGAQSQNVGIGTANPTERLDVAGGIKIGSTANASPGIIRWNEVKNDFEGFNGKAWVSLTGGRNGWGKQQSYAVENEATETMLGSNNSGGKGRLLGNDIAASGNFLIAGAKHDLYSYETAAGSFMLFQKEGTTWKYRYKVTDPDQKSNDLFGNSVDITATHVIAGAPSADRINKDNAGKAFIYTYNAAGATLQATLFPAEGNAGDQFGRSVSIDGDYAAIAAPCRSEGGLNGKGKVYIYQRNSSNQWLISGSVVAPDAAINDYFGNEVWLKGEYLIVGAEMKHFGTNYHSGKVYVYRRSGSAWNLIAQLTPPNNAPGENFGSAIVANGTHLVIGARGYYTTLDTLPGKVYVYTLNGNTVAHQATLAASDRRRKDAFGYSVALSGSTIMVGAPQAEASAAISTGKAYVFSFQNGQWSETAILTASVQEADMGFGWAVALTAEVGIVGAPFANLYPHEDNGRIFFFRY
jgi:hypothetical protein